MTTENAFRRLEVKPASFEDLRAHAEHRELYAILDACDQPLVPIRLSETDGTRWESLYRGTAEQNYWNIAPYLVQVDGLLLDWIHHYLWSEPWGIFAVTQVELATVRHHFRRFLTVRHPDGDEMLFRFYDPRVLPAHLRHSTVDECRAMLGPLECFLVSDIRSGAISRLSLTN